MTDKENFRAVSEKSKKRLSCIRARDCTLHYFVNKWQHRPLDAAVIGNQELVANSHKSRVGDGRNRGIVIA
jgi:hypothetical protein